MTDIKGIKITYESENSLSTWESPYFDATIEDILEGFFGMCISHGWQPSTVISGMQKFVDDRMHIIYNSSDNL